MILRAGRLGLFARVILHGLLLLVISALGFVTIAFVLLGPPGPPAMGMAQRLGHEACRRVADPEADAHALDALPIPVTVFDVGGRRIAASPRVQAPLPPLTDEEVSRLRAHGGPWSKPDGFTAVLCSDDASRYVLLPTPGPRPRPPPPSLRRIAILVLALVVLVALGSIPSARSLVRPLRELVGVAERFGRGELSVRANVGRTDEIGDLARAFNAMAQNLQTRLLAEKELLANVSHELRTPLARVRVVLETAREDPARADAMLKEIGRDLDDLERLTDDVLAALRLDFAGRAPDASIHFRPEPVSVGPLLRQVVTRSVESHPERDVAVHIDEGLPDFDGDPALLRRLFDNLLENAVKYSSAEIEVRARSERGEIVVEVEDRGEGIDEADLPHVFEPFFRSSTRRAGAGSGIGLALCRRIVDAHRGALAATSTAGVGTTFTVRLPVRG